MYPCIAREPSSAGFLFHWHDQTAMVLSMAVLADPEATVGSQHLANLLDAISNGDRKALAEIYTRTSAKIYGVCLRVLGDEAEAQEVLQDVYLTVWHKAALFDSAKAGAITWLAAIARNKAVDRSRRRSIATGDLAEAAAISDDRPSAFEIVQNAQEAARLHACLEELERRSREMIQAAFLQGATYPELAEREGVPLATMKSCIRRGLQRLRGCLER